MTNDKLMKTIGHRLKMASFTAAALLITFSFFRVTRAEDGCSMNGRNLPWPRKSCVESLPWTGKVKSRNSSANLMQSFIEPFILRLPFLSISKWTTDQPWPRGPLQFWQPHIAISLRKTPKMPEGVYDRSEVKPIVGFFPLTPASQVYGGSRHQFV